MQKSDDNVLDDYYFDAQCFMGNIPLADNPLVQNVTRAIFGAALAWWSTIEVLDYLQNKNNFKDFIKNAEQAQ